MGEIRIGSGVFPPPPMQGAARGKAGAASFGDVLKDAVRDVNTLQTQADKAAEGLITGKEPSLHHTLVALEKADVSFQLMMKVRDQIVDAYREVMKMNV